MKKLELTIEVVEDRSAPIMLTERNLPAGCCCCCCSCCWNSGGVEEAMLYVGNYDLGDLPAGMFMDAVESFTHAIENAINNGATQQEIDALIEDMINQIRP